MPDDLVSEPDRGPRRPCAAAVERVIIRELGALEEEEAASNGPPSLDVTPDDPL